MIVDTHAAHRAGSAAGNSHFFNQRAMAHIARCLELMRALDLPFNLRTAYNLLANKDHLKNTLDTVPTIHGPTICCLSYNISKRFI